MPKIEIELSSKSLEGALRELKEYQSKITRLPSKIVLKLVTEGQKLAKINAVDMPEHSDIIQNDIHSEITDNSGKLYTTRQESTYAELGIGIKGSENPHTSIKNWQYDVNEYGYSGWWFPTDDIQLIKKTDKFGQGWGWTRGFASQKFMYNTARSLRVLIPGYARYLLKEGAE